MTKCPPNLAWSRSRDLFKFWGLSHNISETVQYRYVVITGLVIKIASGIRLIYIIAAIMMALSVLGGHFPIESVFKCDFSNLWCVMQSLYICTISCYCCGLVLAYWHGVDLTCAQWTGSMQSPAVTWQHLRPIVQYNTLQCEIYIVLRMASESEANLWHVNLFHYIINSPVLHGLPKQCVLYSRMTWRLRRMASPVCTLWVGVPTAGSGMNGIRMKRARALPFVAVILATASCDCYHNNYRPTITTSKSPSS